MAVFACMACGTDHSSEETLLKVRDSIKIYEDKLQKCSEENVRRAFTKEGIEYGIITLQNGEKIKYWFESHHMSKDQMGGTLFEMPDGELVFIRGYFCCEVQLPKNGRFENSKEFLEEMKKVDGVEP